VLHRVVVLDPALNFSFSPAILQVSGASGTSFTSGMLWWKLHLGGLQRLYPFVSLVRGSPKLIYKIRADL